MNISISRDGQEIGAWTEEQVRDYYKEGSLLPTDSYWKEGMTEWLPLGGFIKPPPPTGPVGQAQPVDRSAKGVSSTTAFIIFAITLICLVYLFFQGFGSNH